MFLYSHLGYPEQQILSTLVRKHPDDRRSLKISQLAVETGVCEKTARTAIKRLRGLNYISASRIHNKGGRGAKYSFEIDLTVIYEFNRLPYGSQQVS